MFHFLFFFYCYTSVSFDLGHIYNKSEGQKVTLEQKKNASSICLCPKLFLSCLFHFTLTLGTGLAIPNTDIIAATLQAQTAHLASV